MIHTKTRTRMSLGRGGRGPRDGVDRVVVRYLQNLRSEAGTLHNLWQHA